MRFFYSNKPNCVVACGGGTRSGIIRWIGSYPGDDFFTLTYNSCTITPRYDNHKTQYVASYICGSSSEDFLSLSSLFESIFGHQEVIRGKRKYNIRSISSKPEGILLNIVLLQKNYTYCPRFHSVPCPQNDFHFSFADSFIIIIWIIPTNPFSSYYYYSRYSLPLLQPQNQQHWATCPPTR